MKSHKLIVKFDQDKSTSHIGTTVPLDYYESKVRFSISKCVIKKSFCISNVVKSKNVLQALYGTLGRFESMTWRQITGLPRDKGISIEKKDDKMHQILSSEIPELTTFGHFRVDNHEKKIFRVFGARKEDLFYIIYFDVDGTLQH